MQYMTPNQQIIEIRHRDKAHVLRLQRKAKRMRESAHFMAAKESKEKCNRSDPFAYGRIYTHMMNGIHPDSEQSPRLEHNVRS